MKLKTAIIGLGPHGKRLYEVVKGMPELSICGLVDINPETASKFTEHAFFSSSADLYEKTNPEVILIATNGPSHARLAIEAMQQGARYVLVEKPMACSLAECNLMEQIASGLSVRLAVNQKNRHDPVIAYIKKNLDSGVWGKIRNISIQIPGIGLGCLATHWTDVASFLIGSKPLKVTGWIDTPKGPNPRGKEYIDPGGLIVMDYGHEMRVVVAQIEDGAGPLTMEIHTTSTRIIYDPKNSFLDIRNRDLNVKPGPGRPPVYVHTKAPEHLNIKGDMMEQLYLVIRELIGSEPMLTHSEHGTAALEIIVAAYISHNKGNIPVDLPLVNQSDLDIYLPIT